MIRFVLSLVIVCSMIACVRKPPLKTGLEGKTMPAFNLLLMDSNTKFSTANIPTGKAAVIFYLSPRCPYCKAELNMILDNMEDLKDIRICLVTNGFPFNETKHFYSEHKLKNYSNIIMGYDSAYAISKYFNISGVPFMSIYGKDAKLKASYVGMVKVSDIVATARE